MTQPRKMRITARTRLISEAIRDGHNWGLAIVKQTGLPQPSTYQMLRRLRENGWVTWETEPEAEAKADRRSPRRLYTLTPYAIDALGWHDL